MATRLRNIDGLKGVLILLVIIGHVLQGKIPEHFGRYWIYSFHMPVFIALSGFLFDGNKMLGLSVFGLFNKYFRRAILPWLIAMVVYAIYLGGFGGWNMGWLGWTHYILQPYYHLWFVPAYMFWNWVLWLILRRGISGIGIILIGLLISWIGYLLKNSFYFDWVRELDSGFGLRKHIPTLGADLLGCLIHTLRPHFFFFFVLGYSLREENLKTPTWLLAVGGGCVMILYWLMFYFPHNIGYNTSDTVMLGGNVFCVIALFRIVRNDSLPKSRPIEWLGEHSLVIYLWHILPLLLVKELIGTKSLNSFYVWMFFAQLTFFALVYLLLKQNHIKANTQDRNVGVT